LNRIRVVNLGYVDDPPGLVEISARLDDLNDMNKINIVNWDITTYKPEVVFKIAYSRQEIYLKYYVREEYVKAEKTGINQDVYEDSCVEFFVSPADDGLYYNFEFNSIGAFLIGSGTGRHDSRRMNPSVARKVRCLPGLGNEPFPERRGQQEWSLTVAIPVSVFFRHTVEDLEGREFMANFYKCGEGLTKPHYLSWNPVLSAEPDFHRPECFGIISFE
jgi:hypothetical protein